MDIGHRFRQPSGSKRTGKCKDFSNSESSVSSTGLAGQRATTKITTARLSKSDKGFPVGEDLIEFEEVTIVRALDISVGTGSVFVWRSVFADLINPHEVSLRSERRLGLSVTGVLGVLLRAKRDGQLNLVKPEIEALRARANFFVDSALETTILATVGE